MEKQLSKNFNESEFVCKCGCGTVHVNPNLISKLQKLRDMVGKPITIVSGYRCAAHNASVGGVPRSQHKLGNAADISISGMSPAEVAKLAEKVGFNGIGRYSTFTHVDVRGYRSRWNG